MSFDRFPNQPADGPLQARVELEDSLRNRAPDPTGVTHSANVDQTSLDLDAALFPPIRTTKTTESVTDSVVANGLGDQAGRFQAELRADANRHAGTSDTAPTEADHTPPDSVQTEPRLATEPIPATDYVPPVASTGAEVEVPGASDRSVDRGERSVAHRPMNSGDTPHEAAADESAPQKTDSVAHSEGAGVKTKDEPVFRGTTGDGGEGPRVVDPPEGEAPGSQDGGTEQQPAEVVEPPTPGHAAGGGDRPPGPPDPPEKPPVGGDGDESEPDDETHGDTSAESPRGGEHVPEHDRSADGDDGREAAKVDRTDRSELVEFLDEPDEVPASPKSVRDVFERAYGYVDSSGEVTEEDDRRLAMRLDHQQELEFLKDPGKLEVELRDRGDNDRLLELKAIKEEFDHLSPDEAAEKLGFLRGVLAAKEHQVIVIDDRLLARAGYGDNVMSVWLSSEDYADEPGYPTARRLVVEVHKWIPTPESPDYRLVFEDDRQREQPDLPEVLSAARDTLTIRPRYTGIQQLIEAAEFSNAIGDSIIRKGNMDQLERLIDLLEHPIDVERVERDRDLIAKMVEVIGPDDDPDNPTELKYDPSHTIGVAVSLKTGELLKKYNRSIEIDLETMWELGHRALTADAADKTVFVFDTGKMGIAMGGDTRRKRMSGNTEKFYRSRMFLPEGVIKNGELGKRRRVAQTASHELKHVADLESLGPVKANILYRAYGFAVAGVAIGAIEGENALINNALINDPAHSEVITQTGLGLIALTTVTAAMAMYTTNPFELRAYSTGNRTHKEYGDKSIVQLPLMTDDTPA